MNEWISLYATCLYSVGFRKIENQYIDRSISIFEKKRQCTFLFFLFSIQRTKNHQNLMWRSWVMIADRHTDRQSHKAFFLPTCLNIFRSVYGTRFARSSNSTGDNIVLQFNISVDYNDITVTGVNWATCWGNRQVTVATLASALVVRKTNQI